MTLIHSQLSRDYTPGDSETRMWPTGEWYVADPSNLVSPFRLRVRSIPCFMTSQEYKRRGGGGCSAFNRGYCLSRIFRSSCSQDGE